MSQGQVALLRVCVWVALIILTTSDLGQHVLGQQSVTYIITEGWIPCNPNLTTCPPCMQNCVCVSAASFFILILKIGHLQGSAHIMTSSQCWIASCLLSVSTYCISLRLSTSLLSSAAKGASLDCTALIACGLAILLLIDRCCVILLLKWIQWQRED